MRNWILWFVLLAIPGCGGSVAPEGNTIVEVNGETITRQQMEEKLKALPPQTQRVYEQDIKGFADELVGQSVLLQEARKSGLDSSEVFRERMQNPDIDGDRLLIQLLAEEVTRQVSVTDEDVRAFIRENRDRLPSDDLNELRSRLEPLVLAEKKQTVLDNWLERQLASSQIVWNQKWLKAQELAQEDNPLVRALKTGNPVLSDFGRGACIPCKKMQPILETLAEEYKDKAEVLIIEIDKYRSLTRRQKIRIIPTQIFFDARGNEVYRHEGFMSRDAIIMKLKELGVE